MSKKIKRIIAISLVFGAFSALTPTASVNLLTTNAYAVSDHENADSSLDQLKLEDSSGNKINIYSNSNYDNDTKLDEGDTPDQDTYFAKTSSSTINIITEGPTARYIKVFKGAFKSTKGKSISDNINLSSGTTTLVIRVYYNKPDLSVTYDDHGDIASEYKIKVEYTGNDPDIEAIQASDYDDIYLDKISVDGENISLSNSKINYSYNVSSNVDKVTVKASPKDEDEDTVSIDDKDLDHSGSYKRIISLNNGDNKVRIEVKDENNKNRVYTLNIIKAATANASLAPAATINVKANQWVLTNAGWQYNDSIGNPLKGWFYDKSNGYWYYLGEGGIMQKGWIIYNGKYYYLNSDGSMAYSATVDGYKLGTDGAWIN